jgi:hypothetical protein
MVIDFERLECRSSSAVVFLFEEKIEKYFIITKKNLCV